MPNPKIGSDRDPKAVHGVPSPKDSYESGMELSHPTIRPQTNYKQRGRSGTDVPIPPEWKREGLKPAP